MQFFITPAIVITMIQLHKFIFQEVCSKNIDLYNEFIQVMKQEFYDTIGKINPGYSIDVLRYNTHKLVGIVSYLDNNDEIIYVCSLILAIDKRNSDISPYYPYLSMLSEISTSKFFP